MTTVRAATTDDLEQIVRLTRSQRRRLSEWSPVYFNPRQGADDHHAGFLTFIVGSEDHQTSVFDDDGTVVGFFVRVQQDRHVWLDDLCVDDETRWPAVLGCLAGAVPGPWVSCVAVADRERRRAMATVGLRELSTYYARPTGEVGSDRATGDRGPDTELESLAETPSDHDTPSHTFGGRPFSPDEPGALVVGGGRGGFVIGSPSMSPPIYDPGGPTCVIDQIVGDDRGALLRRALTATAWRGDAQVVVVCDRDDQQLAAIVTTAGFTPEVILVGV